MHVNVRSVGVGRVGVCMLCTYVNEEGGGEQSTDSETLSLLTYTLRYVIHFRSRRPKPLLAGLGRHERKLFIMNR